MAETTETAPVESRGGVDRPAVGNTTPSAAELMQQGRVEPQEGDGDPWALLGEKAKEIAEAKGWKSPEDMLKAYEAATTRLSQRDEEKESLMAEIARVEAERDRFLQQGQPQSNGQPQQPAPFDFDALAAQLTDPTTGEINMARAMEVSAALGAQMAYQAAEQRMEERFAQFEQQRVAPLSQRAEEERMQAELLELEEVYGEEVYGQIEARVLEKIEQDPEFVDRLGVRGAFANTLYELQQEELAQAAREAAGHTLRGGGRRPPVQQMTPEQAELAAMERARWRPNDGFALHHRLRWG